MLSPRAFVAASVVEHEQGNCCASRSRSWPDPENDSYCLRKLGILWRVDSCDMTSGFPLRAFRDGAASIDPKAEKAGGKHLPLRRTGELSALWRKGGLENMHEQPVSITMGFADYWGISPGTRSCRRVRQAAHSR